MQTVVKRFLVFASFGLIFLALPSLASALDFTCDDGAGGKVMCLPQRGDNLLRIFCKRESLFEIKWVCNAFPETNTTLCRSRDGQQRMLPLAEYDNDAALCTSMCFCPLPSQ